jgi:hypothetical protein
MIPDRRALARGAQRLPPHSTTLTENTSARRPTSAEGKRLLKRHVRPLPLDHRLGLDHLAARPCDAEVDDLARLSW